MARGEFFKPLPPARPSELEWLGGCYSEPDVLIWLELPSGIVLTVRALDPHAPAPIEETLVDAMTVPAMGPARRPSRVRVADRAFAEVVRRALGDQIPVAVGPVPELDSVFAELLEEMDDGTLFDPTYLGDGIVPAVVHRFFATAAQFYRKAPWNVVDEDQVLGVDIPELGVKGHCLSIVGGAGISQGFLLYSSFDAQVRFPDKDATLDSGDRVLSLSYDPRKDLPVSMVREVEQHRWPVAGAKAYPMVMAVDADRRAQPVSQRGYRIVTACTAAFLSFLAKHPRIFDDDDLETAEKTFRKDGLSVTLTIPHPEDW